MRECRGITIAAAIILLAAPAYSEVHVDTVTIGNPGNVDDTHGDGYGGVDYTYCIGKYEVTAGQYTEFLNAVAATDTYELYNTLMDSDLYGCQITRNGSSGSYTYDFSGGVDEAPGSTAADWENRPVNWVSWGDAARFCNWLHNGQPTGAQGLNTTEDGAYYLNGATSNEDLLAVTREDDWTWAIPTEDEWYKAAYHKNDGVTGNYFDWTTSSDSMPSNDLIDPDPGNNATFHYGDYTIGSPYWRTEIGAHENSESPYGTFDQGGNLPEFNDSFFSDNTYRVVRGGSFFHEVPDLHASTRYPSSPASESRCVGFRVVGLFLDCNNNGVPDDQDIATGTSEDCNANGIPDECDLPGDIDADGDVDLSDLAALLANYGSSVY